MFGLVQAVILKMDKTRNKLLLSRSLFLSSRSFDAFASVLQALSSRFSMVTVLFYPPLVLLLIGGVKPDFQPRHRDTETFNGKTGISPLY